MTPEDATRAFAAAFRIPELTVHATEDWILSVRPAQPVVGALVLSTARGALSFSEVPTAARASLVDLIGRAEEAARSLFGAVRMNALCLMMKDPLFHFHLLPRYGAPVDHRSRSWVDHGWPGPPNLAEDQVQSDDDLIALQEAYRSVAWS